MSVANTIPNRINVVVYLKSISFSEKFAWNKEKQLGILDKAVQRIFITDCPGYIKRQLKHKKKPKELLIIAGKSGKILPAASSEKNAFSQISRKQSSLYSKLESGQTISFIFEETDIASFLKAFA